jgi:outer membrane protein assembly factor BamE (lipoprotein component of BamABCDE complex)
MRIAAYIAAVALAMLAFLLASEACFARRSLRRKAALIQVGNGKERVRSLLGSPAESCKGSLGDGSVIGLSLARDAPEQECKIHLFGPDPNEVAVYFDSTGRVVRVHIPAR